MYYISCPETCSTCVLLHSISDRKKFDAFSKDLKALAFQPMLLALKRLKATTKYQFQQLKPCFINDKTHSSFTLYLCEEKEALSDSFKIFPAF